VEGRPPRHSQQGAQKRKAKVIIRNVLLVAAIGGASFTVAGLMYGDPRVVGLLDIRIGPGAAQPGTAQPGTAGGRQPAVERRTDAPPPGLEEEDAPLGTPQQPPVASDSYGFLAVNDDGTPVGYSPCRPLHYVVNPDLVPAGAQHLVPEAIDTISRATGIRFIFDGTTAEQPSGQRDPYQPDSYGDRWAPLLIAWTTPEAAPQLKGKVIGTGGSTHYSYDGGAKTFVTGSLELDAPQITEELRHQDGDLYATAVILHELGHVMGLEHVNDPRQLMYPEIGTPEGLAAGDLNGLHRLGSAQCRKDL
jgi:hypothetical protein